MKTAFVTAIAALSILPLLPLATATHGGPACPTYEINQTAGPTVIHANMNGQFMIEVDGGLAYIVHDYVDPNVHVEDLDGLITHVSDPAPGIGLIQWALDTQQYIAVGWDIGVWVYQEANGVRGLQRHDTFCVTPGYDSTWQADWIVA